MKVYSDRKYSLLIDLRLLPCLSFRFFCFFFASVIISFFLSLFFSPCNFRYHIMTCTWDTNPDTRPSFSTIVQKLQYCYDVSNRKYSSLFSLFWACFFHLFLLARALKRIWHNCLLPCPFRTWTIITLHNFLSYIVLNKVCPITIFPSPCLYIDLHKQIG